MIQARLLGKFAIYIRGNEISLPAGKVRTLAAYLFWKQGEWIRRDFLRGMLWGDVDQERASGSLPVAFHSLRKVLADAPSNVLDVCRDGVRISAGRDLRVDVFAFEQQAITSMQTVSGDVASLTEAVALYRGSFLEDCNENWCLAERRRLSDIYIRVLRELTNKLYASSLYQAAASYARAWATEDPLDEAAHRNLMRVYMAMGQRSRAIDQFEACRSVLAVEMGISPSPETLNLYKEIIGSGRQVIKPSRYARRTLGVNRAKHSFSADPLRNASLLLTYGQDKIRSGENDAGFKALNKALETYERLSDEISIAHARLIIADALLYLHSGPRPQKALLQIERALELNGARDTTIIVYRGLALKALAYYEMGDFVAAKELAGEGLEMAVALNDGETEGRLLTILGMVQRDEYRLAESIASFERAMNLLVSLADPRDRLKLIYERALLSIIIGDYIDAEQLLKETIMTADALSPLPLYKQVAYAAQGHLIFTLLVQGKPIDKEVRKHQADADTYKPQQLSNLTPLLSPAQDPKPSLKDTEAWFRSNLMSLPPASIASMIIVIAGRMISFGFMRDAARWSAVGIRYSRAKGWSGWEAAFCGYRAVITAKLGRNNAAAHWRDLANERMDKMAKQTPAWSAWASGLIARSSGDEATARQYLEESIRRFSESGNQIWAKCVAADLKDANDNGVRVAQTFDA